MLAKREFVAGLVLGLRNGFAAGVAVLEVHSYVAASDWVLIVESHAVGIKIQRVYIVYAVHPCAPWFSSYLFDYFRLTKSIKFNFWFILTAKVIQFPQG